MAATVVRRATDGDVELLAEVRRAWAEEDGVVDDSDFVRTFTSWWVSESDRRVTWIALDGDRPVGMLNVAEFARMPKPGRPIRHWGYLSNLFLLAAYRNAGIGARMLGDAIAEARRREYARLVLHPTDRAKTLYERAGFRRADELLVLTLAGD